MATKFSGLAGCLLALGFVSCARAATPHAATPPTRTFMLLAISWSPSYCERHADPESCGRGDGFVLHGLWPQVEGGRAPRVCPTATAPSEEAVALARTVLSSRRLALHEWESHGACTGLTPDAYYQRLVTTFRAIAIPPALRSPQTPPTWNAAALLDAFVRENPTLRPESVTLHCLGADLAEVRVCLTDDLVPRACDPTLTSNCPAGPLRLAPAVASP